MIKNLMIVFLAVITGSIWLSSASVDAGRQDVQASDNGVFLPMISKNVTIVAGRVTGKVYNNFAQVLGNAEVCYAFNCPPLEEDYSYVFTGLPDGTRTLRASAGETYYPLEQVVEVEVNQTKTLNFTLSPVIYGNGLRFVLTWDATSDWGPDHHPNNMDVHLWAPSSSSTSPEYFYWGNLGDCELEPFACVEAENVDNGYGPNTVYLNDIMPGAYSFAVFYDALFTVPAYAPPFPDSKAMVQVYDATGLVHTIKVPETGEGYWWHVFDYDGIQGSLIIRNTISDSPPVITLNQSYQR